MVRPIAGCVVAASGADVGGGSGGEGNSLARARLCVVFSLISFFVRLHGRVQRARPSGLCATTTACSPNSALKSCKCNLLACPPSSLSFFLFKTRKHSLWPQCCPLRSSHSPNFRHCPLSICKISWLAAHQPDISNRLVAIHVSIRTSNSSNHDRSRKDGSIRDSLGWTRKPELRH